jgi:hypothetical protein
MAPPHIAGAQAGMRAWSTKHRIQTFPRRKQDEGGLLQMDTEEEPDSPPGGFCEAGEVFTLPSGQKRPKRQLRTNVKMSFVHESLYESKEDEYLWFRPAHRRASKRDVAALGRLIADMSGRFADLKPDEPPHEMLQLLPRMSAETEGERDLILTCLRMFDDVLRVKDLSSVNSTIFAKEIRNPTGMSGGLNLMLNVSKEQTRQLLVNDISRQVGLKQAKQRANDRFQKSVTELRLSKAAMEKKDMVLAEMRHKAAAENKKDENMVCARYDLIASSLDNQRRFWASWRMHDGPANESYQSVSKIFADRTMRKANKKLLEPAERDRQIHALAEAYADAQIRQGTNLTFRDDLDANHGRHELPSPRTVFSFRDVPDPSLLHLSLQDIKQHHSQVWRWSEVFFSLSNGRLLG